ncbi:MAG: hypothetical protein LCH63_09915 [Candidatus Melainabacteria bacterium]|nr:hypothetical protein [Candidatus Melainabacteria bacterium]
MAKKIALLAMAFCMGCQSAYADDLFSVGGGSLFKKPLFSGDSLFNNNESQKSGSSAADTARRTEAELHEYEQKKAREDAIREQKIARKEMLMTIDNEMFRQMKAVADWLNNFVVMNHRFPEQSIGGEDPYNLTFGQSDELNIALRQMNILIPNNPYMNAGIYMVPGADVDPNLQISNENPMTVFPDDSKYNRNRVKVIYDRSLNPQAVADLAIHPPYDWQGSPGTVGVVTDGLYYFVVWGAGIDGKPIKDPISGNVRLVLGSYQTWDQPPLQP